MSRDNRPLLPDEDLTWENTDFEEACIGDFDHFDDGDLPVLNDEEEAYE